MQLDLKEFQQQLLHMDNEEKKDDLKLVTKIMCECRTAEDIKDITLEDIARLLNNLEEIMEELSFMSASICELPVLIKQMKRVKGKKRLL